MTELVAAARAGSSLADAADTRTRLLIDGFLHTAGPPPGRFAWVLLGSHARGELHCASDQDHALFWDTPAAAASSYATDLAGTVIDGLERFGMRRCDGGYMADTWSHGVGDWVDIFRDRVNAPTPEAIVDADVFLDVRPLTTGVDVGDALAELTAGADSPRLLHGLATAATSFGTPLHAFGRLPKGPVDVKKTGLAPTVLLARLYGLKARSRAVGTVARLADAVEAGVLSDDLGGRLQDAYLLLADVRLRNQLRQIDAREYLTDIVDTETLTDEEQDALRDAFRAIKSAQSVTSVTFRTDL
jgi:CBS domain-containing protein